MEPIPFRCEVVCEPDHARIRALGELDLASVPILDAAVNAQRAAGYRQLVLDLRTLDFMDSTGLRYLLDIDAEARQDGFAVALVAGPPDVQRVFDITGTTDRLRFIDP